MKSYEVLKFAQKSVLFSILEPSLANSQLWCDMIRQVSCFFPARITRDGHVPLAKYDIRKVPSPGILWCEPMLLQDGLKPLSTVISTAIGSSLEHKYYNWENLKFNPKLPGEKQECYLCTAVLCNQPPPPHMRYFTVLMNILRHA